MFTDPVSMLRAPATYGETVRKAIGVLVFVLGGLLLTGVGTVGSAEPHHVHTIAVDR